MATLQRYDRNAALNSIVAYLEQVYPAWPRVDISSLATAIELELYETVYQFNIVENAEINQHLSTIISRRTQPDQVPAQPQTDPNQMQTDTYTAAPAPKPATTAASYQRTLNEIRKLIGERLALTPPGMTPDSFGPELHENIVAFQHLTKEFQTATDGKAPRQMQQLLSAERARTIQQTMKQLQSHFTKVRETIIANRQQQQAIAAAAAANGGRPLTGSAATGAAGGDTNAAVEAAAANRMRPMPPLRAPAGAAAQGGPARPPSGAATVAVPGQPQPSRARPARPPAAGANSAVAAGTRPYVQGGAPGQYTGPTATAGAGRPGPGAATTAARPAPNATAGKVRAPSPMPGAGAVPAGGRTAPPSTRPLVPSPAQQQQAQQQAQQQQLRPSSPAQAATQPMAVAAAAATAAAAAAVAAAAAATAAVRPGTAPTATAASAAVRPPGGPASATGARPAAASAVAAGAPASATTVGSAATVAAAGAATGAPTGGKIRESLQNLDAELVYLTREMTDPAFLEHTLRSAFAPVLDRVTLRTQQWAQPAPAHDDGTVMTKAVAAGMAFDPSSVAMRRRDSLGTADEGALHKRARTDADAPAAALVPSAPPAGGPARTWLEAPWASSFPVPDGPSALAPQSRALASATGHGAELSLPPAPSFTAAMLAPPEVPVTWTLLHFGVTALNLSRDVVAGLLTFDTKVGPVTLLLLVPIMNSVGQDTVFQVLSPTMDSALNPAFAKANQTIAQKIAALRRPVHAPDIVRCIKTVLDTSVSETHV